jgi:hypothetical protein
MCSRTCAGVFAVSDGSFSPRVRRDLLHRKYGKVEAMPTKNAIPQQKRATTPNATNTPVWTALT